MFKAKPVPKMPSFVIELKEVVDIAGDEEGFEDIYK